MENVTIHGGTITIRNAGVIENVTIYDATVTTIGASNITFYNSKVYPISISNSKIMYSYIHCPEKSSVINRIYAEGCVVDATLLDATVPSSVIFKNSTVNNGTLLLSYRSHTPYLRFDNVSLISENACSLKIFYGVSHWWGCYIGLHGLKIVSKTDHQTPDICLIKYTEYTSQADFVPSVIYEDVLFINGLDVYGNATIFIENYWSEPYDIKIVNPTIHDALYFKRRLNEEKHYILKIINENNNLIDLNLFDDTYRDLFTTYISSENVTLELLPTTASGFGDVVLGYISINQDVKLYSTSSEYSAKLDDFTHEGEYYNFTFSLSSPRLPIKIDFENLSSNQIADVYYDTGNGEIKELGRFYGDENGTLEILYDRGADPVAKVFVKLDGTGLPPPHQA